MKFRIPKTLLKSVGIVVLGIIAANEVVPLYNKAKAAIKAKAKGQVTA